MSSTDIEKKSLEAHVELCAERYNALENKLTNLEGRMDTLEGHIMDVKRSLSTRDVNQYKTLITIGTTIIGVLLTGLVTLLVNTHK
jgi:predicted  nucleic acid-binding Zn-ribbon protein